MNQTIRHVVTFVVLLICALVHHVSSARAELSGNQVVIVANANSQDSLRVAQHYARRREIPLHHIVKLNLPREETISRADYEREVVTPIRQMLQKNGIHHSTRVLVTVYD